MILALLSFWIPCASAEISRDLDPMMPVEPQATVTSKSPVSDTVTGKTSNVVSTADATASGKKADEKKVSGKKKAKSKKSSVAKSPSKKSGKPGGDHSSKPSKKYKKSSN
jgi:hypothetical protein